MEQIDNHYDVIIVGGGPAGCSCAHELLTNDKKVLILDRTQFPRHKPCAGGITMKTLKHLPIDISHLIQHKAQNMVFSFSDKRKVKLSHENGSCVMVIRDKDNNVYETSSHGNFSRNKNKQVNTTFQSWNPTKRWTPTTINVQEKIVGVGFENKTFIQNRYGINIDKLTPKDKVKKLLIGKNKNPEDEDSEKRKYIKNTISVKGVHNLMQSKKDVYQTILPLNDLIIDGFLIDENHSYTPVFLKEVLKDHFKKSIGNLMWVGK